MYHSLIDNVLRENEMIAMLRKGWTVKINGDSYVVLGSRQLRRIQLYILNGPNGRISIRRQDFLSWQQPGSNVAVQVTA